MRNIQATGKMYGEIITLERIQKRTAKKLYDQGKTIYFQTSNYNPFGLWQSLMLVTSKQEEISFENLCNYYSGYNCLSERGKYINFFHSLTDEA